MHKSLSSPNLTANTSVQPKINRNISTNALPDLTTLDAIILSKAPINQAVACIVSNLPNKPDNEMLSCLITPCDPPELNDRLNKNYLQLAIENDKERVVSIRRKKKKDI